MRARPERARLGIRKPLIFRAKKTVEDLGAKNKNPALSLRTGFPHSAAFC
ncbi:MAG: hypothetical protein RLZZ108_448 [Actinomycetota bacterium]